MTAVCKAKIAEHIGAVTMVAALKKGFLDS